MNTVRLSFFSALIAFSALSGTNASAQATDSQPTMLGQFGDWGAYTGTNAGRKVCFALSQPQSAETNPPNRPRGAAHLFISTRPADNVRNEVSVTVGYPFQADYEATAEVDSTRFAMYTQNDGAWVKDANDESRLVDAMRRGATLVIYGKSSRGTETTDRYSLRGVTQALDRLSQECR